MPGPVNFNLNTEEFMETMKRYRTYSRRKVPVIVNTKAFYIARRAVVETPKADKKRIAPFDRATQIILGKIINKRRGKGHGLYGAAMAEAQALVKAARNRSIAFLKSGWLPAIKTLEKLAERPGKAAPRDRNAKQYGRAKGWAVPAQSDYKITAALISNLAEARHETQEGLLKFGGPALQRAIDFEKQSMESYMEEKMREAAHEAGIKTR